MDSVNKEMSEAVHKATADHDLRMKQLQDQIDALEKQYAENMERNRDEEQRLRKEKTRAETALSAKITAYDNDMTTKKKILAELTAAFTQEAAEFSVLKEHFDEVDDDICRSLEEENIIQAVSRREEFGKWVLDHAAWTIQKIVRGRRDRAIVAKLKSKKGKKKGKGKGKKK